VSAGGGGVPSGCITDLRDQLAQSIRPETRPGLHLGLADGFDDHDRKRNEAELANAVGGSTDQNIATVTAAQIDIGRFAQTLGLISDQTTTALKTHKGKLEDLIEALAEVAEIAECLSEEHLEAVEDLEAMFAADLAAVEHCIAEQTPAAAAQQATMTEEGQAGQFSRIVVGSRIWLVGYGTPMKVAKCEASANGSAIAAV